MKNKKELIGWCLFDVANSSYTTIIITVFFGRILAEVIIGPDEGTSNQFQHGNFVWSILLSISWGMTALLGPFFGAWADNSSKRKFFLFLSVVLCATFSFLMYFIPIGAVWFAGFLLVASNLGFSLSENFIASFLPHIADEGDMGKISGWGWGVGYVGGIASIAVCQFLVLGATDFTAEYYDSLRLVGPTTAIFFLVFATPTFLWVKEPTPQPGREKIAIMQLAKSAYLELASTVSKIGAFPDLARFLVSLFFSSGGLAIVISFTSIYASQEVGITGPYLIIYFIILNVAAAFGAVIFGYLQDKIGNLKSINITLLIWVLSIVLIYFLKPMADLLGVAEYRDLFLVVGVLPGLCLGATQAASRALVGLFSPAKHSAEFFGFWGFSAKMAGVFSILGFGFMQSLFELKSALLFCSLFFVISFCLNLAVDEKRGRQTALE